MVTLYLPSGTRVTEVSPLRTVINATAVPLAQSSNLTAKFDRDFAGASSVNLASGAWLGWVNQNTLPVSGKLTAFFRSRTYLKKTNNTNIKSAISAIINQ